MIIENDRIFLPLRDVSELFGKEVFWADCGLVVVSDKNIEKYMNEDRIYDLYNRFDIKVVQVRRSVNCKGNGRSGEDTIITAFH